MLFEFRKKNLSFDRSTMASRNEWASPHRLASKAEEIRKLKSTPNIQFPKKSKTVGIKIG